jgi:hypothetical protein
MLWRNEGRIAMAKTRAGAAKKNAQVAPKRMKRRLISKKRFKSASGGYARVAVLDANTASFGADLLQVFRENVARARKENKRLFGSADRAPSE